MTDLYAELFSDMWKGKPVWEHIRDDELTSVPCMLGSKYNICSHSKIMIVGRAVNGWNADFEDCTSLEATVQSVLTQENRLHEFANKFIEDENHNKYYYAKSSFLRLMKQLVGELTGNYEHWEEYVAWTNLFKLAPKSGKNPQWRMVRNRINTYREILRREIINAQPDLVVFSTEGPSVSYIDPYPKDGRYGSFLDLFSYRNTNDLGDDICATGSFKDHQDTKIVVCRRPERCSVPKLVEEIIEAYSHEQDSRLC